MVPLMVDVPTMFTNPRTIMVPLMVNVVPVGTINVTFSATVKVYPSPIVVSSVLNVHSVDAKVDCDAIRERRISVPDPDPDPDPDPAPISVPDPAPISDPDRHPRYMR